MTRRMSRAQKLWMAERAVVLQVLRDDHPERWMLEELTQEIEDMRTGRDRARWRTVAALEKKFDDCDPEGIRYAIGGLIAAGVAERDGERVRASRCALHINGMGAIGI